jgi:uncharacterized membrane protein YbaN (DUF454 family)
MPNKPSDLERTPGTVSPRRLSSLARLLLVLLGTLCMGLGALGVVLPVLPTTPFLLGAVFCYARSSQRLYSWLLQRKCIAKHLEELTVHKGLTAKSKWSIMGVASTFIVIAAILINKPAMYVVFGVLLGVKVLCFTFWIKTIPDFKKLERK